MRDQVGTAERRALITAAILIVLYATLRTAGAAEAVLYAWTAVAALATLVMPVAGLTILAALGPFTEAQAASGMPTFVPVLLATLGLSTAVRLVVARGRPLLVGAASVPVLAAIALGGITLVGVGVSFLNFGPERGSDAMALWVPGIGGGMTVLAAAALTAALGARSVLPVAVACVVVAALVATIDFLAGGAILHSPLGWLLRGHVPFRLSQIIPAPNAAATIFLAAAAVTLAAAVLGGSRRVRGLGLAGTAVLGLATVLTFSRSALLAAALIVIVIGWLRWRGLESRSRRFTLIGAGVVLGLLALSVATGLLQLRNVPPLADQFRIEAWAASVRMWLDAPLLGHGFRSFEWLHEAYGSQLDAPHNEWLRLFAEEGAAGGLIGAAFIGLTTAILLRTREWLTYACAAAAAGLAVMASFNNPFLYAQVNVPVFLIVGSGVGLAIARVAGREPEASEPG